MNKRFSEGDIIFDYASFVVKLCIIRLFNEERIPPQFICIRIIHIRKCRTLENTIQSFARRRA